jgi:hypothetical protein
MDMPKYWLASKMAPTPPVLDWLKWNLERHIAESGTIVTIIGINKMGDLQTIYSPVVIPNAFSIGNAAIIGNISDVHTEPAFVYTDASNIGSIMTVATYNNIPSDLHLEEHQRQGEAWHGLFAHGCLTFWGAEDHQIICAQP